MGVFVLQFQQYFGDLNTIEHHTFLTQLFTFFFSFFSFFLVEGVISLFELNPNKIYIQILIQFSAN